MAYHYAANSKTGRYFCNGSFDALLNDAQLLDDAELAVVRATFENVISDRAHDSEPVIEKVIRERDSLRLQLAEAERERDQLRALVADYDEADKERA